ncbi:uncharacterized protein F5Z01DRAFT_75787 [Emericellopsis atlantica]|uniref:Uncharacterized protein n=1 Tax=Emericellopsis atlantica TaxID=2614577 RepID=A0A9P7ZNX6_9HYPO|nr:uncharacterized protein F5Z01DRAFT_75787 [Emericellopsis atlantica]KAG9255141.1 hypothetical protein F5Z01DRAFT_75787 [Emericellopsis atlantica]
MTRNPQFFERATSSPLLGLQCHCWWSQTPRSLGSPGRACLAKPGKWSSFCCRPHFRAARDFFLALLVGFLVLTNTSSREVRTEYCTLRQRRTTTHHPSAPAPASTGPYLTISIPSLHLTLSSSPQPLPPNPTSSLSLRRKLRIRRIHDKPSHEHFLFVRRFRIQVHRERLSPFTPLPHFYWPISSVSVEVSKAHCFSRLRIIEPAAIPLSNFTLLHFFLF